MGTLMGHILPGTFFAIFGVWWGFCLAIKYFHSRHSMNKSRKPIPYESSTTFSCLCLPSPLRQMPIESYIKLICISIGILGEFITGYRSPYDEVSKHYRWVVISVNSQHIAMFFAFGFAAFIEILVHARYNLPKGIEYIFNIGAFAIEGLLFHFHLHGRDEVDIHIHTLLVYDVAFCVLAGIWEFNRPNQILATYCRTLATLLQGIWFYAVGFILYFPSKDPYWVWPQNHDSILYTTVMFIWFVVFAATFLMLQTVLVWKILKRRYGDLLEYSILDENDDDEMINGGKHQPTNDHPLKPYRTNNGSTIIPINNHEDNESGSEIEFERQKFTSKI